MAPTIRNYAITGTAPANVATLDVAALSGDLMVAFGNKEDADPTISGTEWTPVALNIGTGYSAHLACWTRPVPNDGTQTVTIGGNMLAVYALVDTDRADAVSTGTGFGDATQTAAALTTTTADSLVLGGWAGQSGGATNSVYSAPTEMILDATQTHSSGWGSIMTAHETRSAIGSTGTRTATPTPATTLGWAALLVSFPPTSLPPNVAVDPASGAQLLASAAPRKD